VSPAQYKSKREKLGLTQAGLAALLEVTRETVNRRESGEQPITHEAALAISSLRPAKTKRPRHTPNDRGEERAKRVPL
jgi:DNA-binding XRE family transcriptional regulator